MVEIKLADRNRASGMKLHPANIEEVEAMYGMKAETVLIAIAHQIERLYEVFVDNRVVCLLGLHQNKVSLLFADEVDRLPVSFFRESKQVVDELRRGRPSLGGRIYYKNELSKRWAKFLGFVVTEPVPCGARNELFHEFYTEVK